MLNMRLNRTYTDNCVGCLNELAAQRGHLSMCLSGCASAVTVAFSFHLSCTPPRDCLYCKLSSCSMSPPAGTTTRLRHCTGKRRDRRLGGSFLYCGRESRREACFCFLFSCAFFRCLVLHFCTWDARSLSRCLEVGIIISILRLSTVLASASYLKCFFRLLCWCLECVRCTDGLHQQIVLPCRQLSKLRVLATSNFPRCIAIIARCLLTSKLRCNRCVLLHTFTTEQRHCVLRSSDSLRELLTLSCVDR
jgi:hypothetical protein